MDAAASSVEARRRVYLLTQAENMNTEAANRFLKTLEEPAPRTTFVLTSAQPSRLLPTIISRCQTLTLHPLHGAELREALAARWPELPEARREQIAALSGGAFGRALRLVETPELLSLRGKVLDLLAALPRREPWEALRQGELLLELTEQWWLAEQPGDLGRDFLKHAHDAAVRAKLGDVLQVMHSWFRDLLALERPDLLTNPDYRSQLEAAARRYPPASALAASQVLEELRADLGQNPNLRLAAETLFIRLLAARRA
jgi:DNA polymerase-3 subunit delta'